jgi:aldehyde:ferredoxin oxidoreductase
MTTFAGKLLRIDLSASTYGEEEIPDRYLRQFISAPLRNAGPSTGQVVKDLDKLLDEYYEAFGYTGEGIPSVGKLKDLGIEELVKEITNDRRFLAN